MDKVFIPESPHMIALSAELPADLDGKPCGGIGKSGEDGEDRITPSGFTSLACPPAQP
jgi:hypothetical protein